MKIEMLYPEVANLYGDLANAKYLARSCGAELVETKLGEEPHFVREEIALVTLCGTTERGQELCRDALAPWQEALRARTEQGGVTLITGNALELFGEYILTDAGEKLPMLGWFPTYAQRRMMARHNSLYLGKLGEMKIVGFKSQFSHSYGENCAGLFTTLRGVGLNPEVQAEGFREKNLMATYLLGPLLILNPEFTKYILSLMGVERPALAFEEQAMEVYQTRLAEFEDPKRGFGYGN
ncbi:MAG: hypothetical protein ACSW8F_06710 [bacterium]